MTAVDEPLGNAVAFAVAGLRGLRDDRTDLRQIEAAVALHEDPRAPARRALKDDERSLVTASAPGEEPGTGFVVKEVRKAGTRRRLADALRGAPARRGFRSGRALLAAGIGAARPVAFLERRRLGVPVRSLLVSEDLRPTPTAAALLASEPSRRADVLASLAELLVALHRGGFVHGDLRVQHVHGTLAGSRPALRLIDLESVRRLRAVRDDQRMEDLAQMNASIADDVATIGDRRAAFDRYVAELPFSAGSGYALGWIVRRSIERGHLFRGRDLQNERCRSADPATTCES